MDGNTFTTQPVAATWGVDPEFIDLPGLEARFAIRRSNAYALISQGLIRSVVLRRKGCKKGRRLVNVQSVRQFLESLSDDIDPAMSANCKKAQKASVDAKREKAEAQ
jgi:hypothetical protein